MSECVTYSRKYSSWQQVLSYKYQYQYQYQRSKYQYNYQYLACKYKYKYQYLKIVLKYRSSTSTSTQYNKTGVIWSLVCNRNTTLFVGCPTGVTIISSTGTYDEGAVLTCVANGYLPSYEWTGAAGVNRDFIMVDDPTYTLPGGPFDLICTATVSQLSCCSSAVLSDRSQRKYQTQHRNLVTTLMVMTLSVG